MAYNNRNLLNKIIEIQTITLREHDKGIPYITIFERFIAKQYHISYSTFNNYLSRNAKKELEILNREEAERKRQIVIEF